MDEPTVLLSGNPNAGKTTLFNALTGSRARVGNYPGITVEAAKGSMDLGPKSVSVVDLPGSYSLTARSKEESVAMGAILGAKGAVTVVVLDATTLGRGLYFATQVLETGARVIVALTMMDEAEAQGLEIDERALAVSLGCDVVGLVVTQGRGLDALRAALLRAFDEKEPTEPLSIRYSSAVESKVAALILRDGVSRAEALFSIMAGPSQATGTSQGEARDGDLDLEKNIIEARYRWIDGLGAVTRPRGEVRGASRTERIDRYLVHPVWGTLAFLATMFVVFQALFSWAEPMTSAIEWTIEVAKRTVAGALPPGSFTDLLVEGVIGGVGNVVVFIPQIALLFIFINLLEDSGYLARVAFVIDGIMSRVGLSGRAFVPMLGGFACAIPAVMATRTLETRRDRLLTMLVIPLTSCSARLPVYLLITATVFDPEKTVLSVVSLGALVLFALYALSLLGALFAAAVLGRTVLPGPRPALVLELPPYRLPRPRNVLLATAGRVKRFVVDAGTTILALSIVLWGLLNFPTSGAYQAEFDARQATIEAELPPEEVAEALSHLDKERAGAKLRESYGGRFGRAIEPVLLPLGFDWRIGVGLVGSFAAREVFVSTLAMVYDLDGADEKDATLHAALRQAKHEDGSSVFTPLTGVSLMVFFVFACQCMSTLAVVRRESGSWRWPALLFGYMTVLAYGVTLIVYQGGKALGF